MVRPTLARARELAARVRNAVRARSYAGSTTPMRLLPTGGVALYFATDPVNLYQFEQWRRPLEELSERIGVFVIVDRPDTGSAVHSQTSLPVTFARSSVELERLVADRDVRVVLYANQVEPNFRMLRFGRAVHVQLGHGESDKDSSVSHQHQAYDVTFVGGEVGRERLSVLRNFDVSSRTQLVGRPQLDYSYPGGPPWAAGDGIRVFYAPTWEGARPAIRYGSLVSHGAELVEALLADPEIRIIYRPHPRTGTGSAAHTAADTAIRRRLRTAGDRAWIDVEEYGWQWGFADACVTDVSAVAYDWLATGKPLVVTKPIEAAAYLPPSPLLQTLPLLPAGDAGRIRDTLREAGLGSGPPPAVLERLRYAYFGDVADRASTRRFESAVLELAAR